MFEQILIEIVIKMSTTLIEMPNTPDKTSGKLNLDHHASLHHLREIFLHRGGFVCIKYAYYNLPAAFLREIRTGTYKIEQVKINLAH
jgi:hypothetical protein